MRRSFLSLVTLATAAACASPNPATVSAADVDRAFAEAQYLSGRPFTATGDLPTGSTTYRGQLGADVSGDLQGSLLGDMVMTVNFADNDVGGSVSDINLIDSAGRPDQRLDGSLGIAGYESGGRIDAFASGQLTAVDSAGGAQQSDMLLVLDGDVVDDRGYGDAVFGSATGSGSGDLNLGVEGVFFGTSD